MSGEFARDITKKDREIAKKVRASQKSRGRSTNSVATIAQVKRLWDNAIPYKQIAKLIGVTRLTVKHICDDLSKYHLRSPILREKAIVAAEDILSSDDNANRVKLIGMIFQENKGFGINLNINNAVSVDPKEIDFSNTDYKFKDIEGY